MGPTPQLSPESLLGEIKAVNCMAPMPLIRLPNGSGTGWEMTGMMVRVMRFQIS